MREEERGRMGKGGCGEVKVESLDRSIFTLS